MDLDFDLSVYFFGMVSPYLKAGQVIVISGLFITNSARFYSIQWVGLFWIIFAVNFLIETLICVDIIFCNSHFCGIG